jgi:CheY-like chemotaxis protein
MDLLRRNGFTRFLIKPLKPWALLDLPPMADNATGTTSPGHTGVVGKLKEKNLRFLLVDDSNDNLFLLKEVVEPLASTIHFAENGLEAISKFNENTYDVVFMDIQMPVMDGYTAIRKMREAENAAAKAPVPIYAVTAHSGLVDAQKCREAGFTDRIVKPVARGDIYRQLSKSFALEFSEPEESESLPAKYLARLLPTFLKTRFEDMSRLKTALTSQDFQAIAQLGHKMKGSSASYGFPVISTTSQALEAAAKAHDLQRCSELAGQLGDMFISEQEKFEQQKAEAIPPQSEI